MGGEDQTLLGYGRTMRRVLDLARRAQSLVQRRPLAADTVLALTLAITAFGSLDATYSELPEHDSTFSHGWTVAVVVSMLAITLPLAWRRRFPFSVAVVVVGAFLFARIVVNVPEANISLFALWLMLYSVYVHGQRRFRIPVITLCYSVLVAELVREIYFASDANGPPLAGARGSGHGVIVCASSGPGLDLVAQGEVGAGVTGSGSGEVLTQLRDGGGGPLCR